MSFHNIFALGLLLSLYFFVLIRQHHYLITASVSRIYTAFTLMVSFITLTITFFVHTNKSDLVWGIAYSFIFLLLSFMRKGITGKGLIGSKGDSCKWSKVHSAKLIKEDNRIKFIYSQINGESYMYFNYSDYAKLINILRQFLSDEKISSDI